MTKENMLTDIHNHFLLPIELEETKQYVTQTLKKDLEINTFRSPYHILFNTKIEKQDKDEQQYNQHTLLHTKWNSYYSTDTTFLQSFQSFICNYDISNNSDISNNDDRFFHQWREFKGETSFEHKYDYITWKQLRFLNNSPYFLQGMSYYNLSSPLVNLSIPILFLILPFIMLKYFSRIPITFYNYKQLLYKQFSNHAIGKIFNLFSNQISTEKKLTASFTIAFYFFTLYQNILSCFKFHKNIKHIHSFLFQLKTQLKNTITRIEMIEPICKKSSMKTYQTYLREKKEQLIQFYDEFSFIKTDTFTFKHLFYLGDELRLFNMLYHDSYYNELISFTFGLSCFHENILSLYSFIKEKKLNKCKFIRYSKKDKHTKERKKISYMKQQYYIYHINETPVLNDVSLNKNYIITGPNASGKTTLIKSTLLNLLFSQQFGVGCYKKCCIKPYDNFYSYINIPDTSQRDSLFQAEARRCLDMIQDIERKKGNSFIIFDELYSGTNPDEAIITARAFLQYLQERNIQFMLTTHFTELTCLNKEYNYKMSSFIREKNIEYTYKLEKGINKIKGGIKVLEDLQYPKEILNKL